MQKTGAVINFPKTAKTTITLNFDLLDSKTWTLKMHHWQKFGENLNINTCHT